MELTSMWILKGVMIIAEKLPKCGVLPGPYFPVLGPSTVL